MKLLEPKLKAFVAVAQYKTVHQAAQALFLTQTAVTSRIKLLEEKLGVALFIRSRQGMELTSEGQALLRYCHSFHVLERSALQEIQGQGMEAPAEIHIAGPTSIMCARVIPACTALCQQFPQLGFRFSVLDHEERHLLLKQSGCDLAILPPEQVTTGLAHKILEPEHYVLVACDAWKNRDLKEIIQTEKIIDYLPEDRATFDYLKQYGLFDWARHERHFANHTESLSYMISKGLGYSVLTTEFMEPFLQRHELAILNEGKTYENPVVLAWYERPLPPPYFDAILQAIQ